MHQATFYESLISAMRSGDPKQALNNLDVTMPETIIESVFEEFPPQDLLHLLP